MKLKHELLNAGMREKQQRVYFLREEKATFREIGNVLGISSNRAREIYVQALHKIKLSEDPATRDFCALSMRACNVLWNYDLTTREKAIAAIKAGAFEKKNRVRNCAEHTYRELCAWAGVTPKPWGNGGQWKFNPYTGKKL